MRPIPDTGLPDDAALSALASELFRALPGNGLPTPPGQPLLPGGLPTATPPVAPPNLTTALAAPLSPPVKLSQAAAGEAALPPSLITPRLLPTQAQSVSDLPAYQSTVLPALPRGGGALASPPEAPVAAAQSAAATATPSGAPPFYFLDGASALATAAPIGTPEAFALPSLPAVPALREPALREPPATAAPVPGAASYYFVDARQPAAASEPRHALFDVHAIRRDFPILSERVSSGRQLIWLDNAATTQKPRAVIDRLTHFYEHENSNIHRAAHDLAARATEAYEQARRTVARFVGASSESEIVFVRGTTEGINLVAQSWGCKHIGEGDEIVISHLEHHANIVPWQMLAAEVGAKLRVIPVDDHGQVRLDAAQKLIGPRTRIVSVTQVSNALGTVVPVQALVEMAHRVGARALVDGAQSVSHMPVDVRALDADFFVFSGHKIFGPTGIGAVYGKAEVLEDMPPYQGGGNMIEDVTFERTVYHGAPARFEAGTGNIADAAGLGAALDYVQGIGIERIARYEHELLEYGMERLRKVPGLRLIGTAPDKASVMSFVLTGHSNEDVGRALNREGIAVRSGHHCAQPILRRFGQESTVRPSLAFYNTTDEIDCLVDTLRRLVARSV